MLSKQFSFYNSGEVAVDFAWMVNAPFTFTPAAGRLQPGEAQHVVATFNPLDASVSVANVRTTRPLSPPPQPHFCIIFHSFPN